MVGINFETFGFDRTPPHSLEAELAVLSAVMREPSSIDEVRPLLRPDSFFLADHAIIYESLCALNAVGKPIDVLLLREHLKGRGLLKEIGGSEMLASLFGDGMLYTGHVGHYTGIVVENAKLRELLRTSLETARACCERLEDGVNADVLAERVNVAVDRIRDTGTADTIRTLEEVVAEVIAEKKSGTSNRLLTGLTELDELAGGVPLALMTLIAGKAGMGKSQLCKQIVRNIAGGIGKQEPIPCGIITIEENAKKIATNYLAGASGVANNRIVYNTMIEAEFREVEAAAATLHIPIVIDDARDKLSDIRRTARRMVRKHGCRVIVVDHLHLIDGEVDGTREQEISQISRGLKMLFKELGVCGIVAAQLNRGGEREAMPELDNLRGSGTLEQDGDLIIQLHRQDYFEWKKHGNDFKPDHKLTLYVNKNKDGPVGSRDTYFDGDSQTVTDWNCGNGPRGSRDCFAPGVKPANAVHRYDQVMGNDL